MAGHRGADGASGRTSGALTALARVGAAAEDAARVALAAALAGKERAAGAVSSAEAAEKGARSLLASARQDRVRTVPRPAHELVSLRLREERLAGVVKERAAALNEARAALGVAAVAHEQAREELVVCAREREALERHLERRKLVEKKREARAAEAQLDDLPRRK